MKGMGNPSIFFVTYYKVTRIVQSFHLAANPGSFYPPARAMRHTHMRALGSGRQVDGTKNFPHLRLFYRSS